MAISLEKFKEFASLPTSEIPAVSAKGLLVITKKPSAQNRAFTIPKDFVFVSAGMGYYTSEQFEFSESSRMIEIAVQARVPGGGTRNRPANSQWNTEPLSDLVASNPNAFTEGADRVQPNARGHIDWNKKSVALCQSQMDIAQKNILTKLGNPDQLPDDPRVDRAVYLLAQFYIENRQTQETQTKFDLGSAGKTKTTYYRERIFQAINREIDNILNPLIDVSKFMAPVPGQTE